MAGIENKAVSLKIDIGGSDAISDLGMLIHHIVVDSSMTKTDYCTFEIGNAYDVKESKLKWVDDSVKEGKTITVSMGYGDSLTQVFSGLIISVGMKSSGESGVTLTVSAYDKSFLMMQGKKTMLWKEKTHSDILSAIVSKYGLSAKSDATSTVNPLLVQNHLSDYELIMKLATDMSFNAFAYCNDFYFQDFTKGDHQSDKIELQAGLDLLYFECDNNVAEQLSKVKVKSYDPFKRELVEGEYENNTPLNSGSAKGYKVISDIDDQNVIKEVYSTVKTKAEAEQIAKSEMNVIGGKYFFGRGESFGNSSICPGKYVDIKGYGDVFDKAYCVISATHIWDDNGYLTKFEFGSASKLLELNALAHPQNSPLQNHRALYGLYVAKVTEITDQNKVKVTFPSRAFEDIEVDVVAVSAGNASGQFFFPSKDDQVMIAFLEGDFNSPYMIGAIWDDQNKFPVTVKDNKNDVRLIRTPAGHEFRLDDTDGKETIVLKTKKGHEVTLDDADSGAMTLKTSDGKETIKLDVGSGLVAIEADQKMTITVKGVSIKVDGSGGKVAIEGSTAVEIKAPNIKLDASGMMEIKSGGTLKLESSGLVMVKGSMVKIN